MPRKIQSSGESTQQKKTFLKPKGAGHSKKSGDGGPWAGTGAMTRSAKRTMKANHPNHG